jgi:hypothetical protein
MFSAQMGTGSNASSTMWVITPRSTPYIRVIDSVGRIAYAQYKPSIRAAKPTITLKSGIKIVDGSGTKNDPFEISE